MHQPASQPAALLNHRSTRKRREKNQPPTQTNTNFNFSFFSLLGSWQGFLLLFCFIPSLYLPVALLHFTLLMFWYSPPVTGAAPARETWNILFFVFVVFIVVDCIFSPSLSLSLLSLSQETGRRWQSIYKGKTREHKARCIVLFFYSQTDGQDDSTDRPAFNLFVYLFILIFLARGGDERSIQVPKCETLSSQPLGQKKLLYRLSFFWNKNLSIVSFLFCFIAVVVMTAWNNDTCKVALEK